ncbi:MAG: tyrosine-type recombinase/integrase [Acidimicrobiales bacterium]
MPPGKLHNDRYVPLHSPGAAAGSVERHPRRQRHRLLLTNRGRAINRQAVVRMPNRAGRRAGLGHLHPHQLRHTLATQAVNRGAPAWRPTPPCWATARCA